MGRKSEDSGKIFPEQRWGWARVLSVAGAFLVTAGLFMIIPLTQLIEGRPEADLVVREVELVSLPPPEIPPPPEEEERPPPQERSPVSEPDTERPEVEVRMLDVTLPVGSGDAIAIGAEIPEFELEAGGIAAAIEELFTFEDLPEAPRLLNMPRFRFPRALQYQGVNEGKVVVEIDILPDGRAEFRRIISSTHQELEPVAREIVQQARFSRPVVDGRPQTVRGHFPILLSN